MGDIREERRIAVMERMAEALGAGLGPIASLRKVAEEEPALASAVSIALAEPTGEREVFEATKEFFGPDYDWLSSVLTGVDNRTAGRILKDAASVTKIFHQLLEERKAMLRVKKGITRVLIGVLGTTTAILGTVSTFLWSALLISPEVEAELHLAVMGGAFAALLLDEVRDSLAWLVLFLVSYILSRLLASALLPR